MTHRKMSPNFPRQSVSTQLHPCSWCAWFRIADGVIRAVWAALCDIRSRRRIKADQSSRWVWLLLERLRPMSDSTRINRPCRWGNTDPLAQIPAIEWVVGVESCTLLQDHHRVGLETEAFSASWDHLCRSQCDLERKARCHCVVTTKQIEQHRPFLMKVQNFNRCDLPVSSARVLHWLRSQRDP